MLYAPTMPIGTMKKTTSQASGRPRRPGVARLRRLRLPLTTPAPGRQARSDAGCAGDAERHDEEDDEPGERQAEETWRRQVETLAPAAHYPVSRSSGRFHLLPESGVHRPPWHVPVDVRIRLANGVRIGEPQHLEEVARPRPCLEVGRA